MTVTRDQFLAAFNAVLGDRPTLIVLCDDDVGLADEFQAANDGSARPALNARRAQLEAKASLDAIPPLVAHVARTLAALNVTMPVQLPPLVRRADEVRNMGAAGGVRDEAARALARMRQVAAHVDVVAPALDRVLWALEFGTTLPQPAKTQVPAAVRDLKRDLTATADRSGALLQFLATITDAHEAWLTADDVRRADFVLASPDRFDAWADEHRDLRIVDLERDGGLASLKLKALVDRGALKSPQLQSVYEAAGDRRDGQFSFAIAFQALPSFVVHAHCRPDVPTEQADTPVTGFALLKAHVKATADERRSGKSYDLPLPLVQGLVDGKIERAVLARWNELRVELMRGVRVRVDERHNLGDPIEDVERWAKSLRIGRVADLFRTVRNLPGHWIELEGEVNRARSDDALSRFEAKVRRLAEERPETDTDALWTRYGTEVASIREGIVKAYGACQLEVTDDDLEKIRREDKDKTYLEMDFAPFAGKLWVSIAKPRMMLGDG